MKFFEDKIENFDKKDIYKLAQWFENRKNRNLLEYSKISEYSEEKSQPIGIGNTIVYREDSSLVYRVFGDWAATEDGLISILHHYYTIGRSQLQSKAENWPLHMRIFHKSWVYDKSFLAAHNFGLRIYGLEKFKLGYNYRFLANEARPLIDHMEAHHKGEIDIFNFAQQARLN